jgi:hypothetical protein
MMEEVNSTVIYCKNFINVTCGPSTTTIKNKNKKRLGVGDGNHLIPVPSGACQADTAVPWIHGVTEQIKSNFMTSLTSKCRHCPPLAGWLPQIPGILGRGMEPAASQLVV